MIHKILHRLYMGIVTIGCTMLWTLSGCDNDTLDSFLQFSDDNLLLRAAGDTVVIDVTAGSGWEAESMADWCTVEKNRENPEGKLVIRVSPSDDIYERGTAVKVTCGDLSLIHILCHILLWNGCIFILRRHCIAFGCASGTDGI